MLRSAVFHSVLILPFVRLLSLAIHVVLPQLVVTVAAFEPLEEILAVDVLDDWSRHHACKTLKYSTARAARSFVDFDHGVGLTNVVALNASRLLST